MSGFASGVCPPTEAVDVGHSNSPTAGGSEGPGDCLVQSSVSAPVSSRSASAAASFSQAGSLPGDSRIALLIASRAVDASLHPLCPFFARARTTSKSCRGSGRASPGGLPQLRHAASRQSRSRTDCGQRYQLACRSERTRAGPGSVRAREMFPPQAYAESRGPRWSRIHGDWPPVGIIPPVQTMRRPPALDRPGVALCRQSGGPASCGLR
jgi:hypothetical protein